MNFSLTRKQYVVKENIESVANKVMPEVKSALGSAPDTGCTSVVSSVQNQPESEDETLAERRLRFRHSWDMAEGYAATNPWRAVAATSLNGRVVGALLGAGRRY